jgi:menaquinone-dependent protoporphyrinogen oxidase
MDERILVAYATKYGATAEIAQKIGEQLSQSGLTAEVHPVGQVSSLTPYWAVILGSAVYVGQWRKEAAAFLRDHEPELAVRPVWLFSTGPTGVGDPVQLMKGWRFPESLQPVADRIRPRGTAFFHGALDLQRLSVPDKLIVKGVKAPIGDFRDWKAIAKWTAEVAKELEARRSAAAPAVA